MVHVLLRRVKKAYRFIILLCAIYTSIMFIFAWTISPYFVGLFTQSEALANEAIKAIHICTLFIIPLGVQYAIVDIFTAMGQVKFALSLSFWRKLIYFTRSARLLHFSVQELSFSLSQYLIY